MNDAGVWRSEKINATLCVVFVRVLEANVGFFFRGTLIDEIYRGLHLLTPYLA